MSSRLVEGLRSDVLEWTADNFLSPPLSDRVAKASSELQLPGHEEYKDAVSDALGDLEGDKNKFSARRLQAEQPELVSESGGCTPTIDLSAHEAVVESEEYFVGIAPTDDDDDNLLLQFFDLLVGDKKEVELDDNLLAVESRSFTSEVLLDCYKKCKGKGLARELLPFMVDQLKRQQSLAVSDAIIQANDELTDTLTFEYLELSHKEMFISLLEITPTSIHSKLVSLAVSIGCSVPFIYRRILPNGNIAMRLLLDTCRNLFGAENNPLVLSCGTSSTVNRGKSDLIGELFGLSASSQSRSRGLSLNSSSPCHKLSIDLLFNTVLSTEANFDSIVLADAHGFSSKSFGFTTALCMLMSIASTTVIHVSKRDFTDLGVAGDDVKSYIDCFTKNNKQFGKATGSCLVFIWRDYERKDEKIFEAVKVWLEKALSQKDGLSFYLGKMANLSKLGRIQRIASLKRLHDVVLETMTSHYKGVLPALGQTEELVRRLHEVAKTNVLFRGFEHDASLPVYSDRRKTLIKIESNVKETLDRSAANLDLLGHSKLGDSLFPILTLKTEHSQLEEEMRHLSSVKEANNEVVTLQLLDLEKSMKDKEELISSTETSSFVKNIASFVLKGDLEAIDVVKQTLAKWKLSRQNPLLKYQKHLRDKLEKRIGELQVANQEEKTDKNLNLIRNKLAKIKQSIDAFDVSIDDVWGELISLAVIELKESRYRTVQRIQKECYLSRERLAKTCRDWLMQGNPMQLLRGSPLYTEGEFLSSILRLFEEGGNRRVFVISVIGKQNSAKSTLLNYLFGCRFETRASQCTRGLYASYMRTNELDLLILDSEGLMSVEEREGRYFDNNKVTLMAIACSHVVITNHKDSLARQLHKLLEVVGCARKHLEVMKRSLECLVVLRDQSELTSGESGLQYQLIQMQQSISATDENVKIKADSLILLPNAFIFENRNGKDIDLPSSFFSDKCLVLRRKILNLYGKKFERHGSDVGELSLQQWSVHARSVWSTIRHFGASLLQFENMQQIEQRRELTSLLARIVKECIQASGGHADHCWKQMLSYFNKSRWSTMAEFTHLGIMFKTELSLDVYYFKEKAQKRFAAALEAGKYNPSWKSLFSHKLDNRIDEITAMYVRIWDRREREMKEQMHADEIEQSLVERMDRAMRKQEMTTFTSNEELEKSFEQLWTRHDKEVHSHLRRTSKSEEEIGKNVCASFQALLAVYTSLDRADPVYTVVTPKNRVYPISSLIVSRTVDYYKSIIHHTSLATNCIQVQRLEQGQDIKDSQKEEAAYWLKQEVWSFIKKLTSEVKRELEQTQSFGQAARKTREVILQLNERLAENFEMTVKMHALVNGMFDCLLFLCVHVLGEKQKADIENKKENIRERCKLLLSESRDDVGCAKCLVREVLGGLIDWCQMEAIAIVVEIENELREMLPDWLSAASIAFEESFLKEDWAAVLDYCENALGFTWSLFDKRYSWLEMNVAEKKLVAVQRKISEEQAFLREIVMEWGKARQMTNGIKTSDLVEFARERRQNPSATSTLQPRWFCVSLDVLQFIPQDVGVRDPTRFAQSFVGHLDERLNRTPTASIMEDVLRRDIAASKESFWKGLRGCSKQCPICGSMCDQEEGHLELGIKHSCQEHLLPAFHGSRNPTTREPIFQLCTSAETQKMPWRSRENPDHSRDSLAKYLKDFHPEWNIPTSATAPQLLKLRRAWVKCRKPILRMKKMVDSTPIQWIRQFGGSDELSADVESSFSKGIGASKASSMCYQRVNSV